MRSILGETYEYATKEALFLAEQVSNNPPVGAFNIIGDGF